MKRKLKYRGARRARRVKDSRETPRWEYARTFKRNKNAPRLTEERRVRKRRGDGGNQKNERWRELDSRCIIKREKKRERKSRDERTRRMRRKRGRTRSRPRDTGRYIRTYIRRFRRAQTRSEERERERERKKERQRKKDREKKGDREGTKR